MMKKQKPVSNVVFRTRMANALPTIDMMRHLHARPLKQADIYYTKSNVANFMQYYHNVEYSHTISLYQYLAFHSLLHDVVLS